MLPTSPSLMIRLPAAYCTGYIQSTISRICVISRFFMKSLSGLKTSRLAWNCWTSIKHFMAYRVWLILWSDEICSGKEVNIHQLVGNSTLMVTKTVCNRNRITMGFIKAYTELFGILTKSLCAPCICDRGSALWETKHVNINHQPRAELDVSNLIAVRFKRDVSGVWKTRVFSTPGAWAKKSSSLLRCTTAAFVKGRTLNLNN